VGFCSDPVAPGEDALLRESLLSSVEVQSAREGSDEQQPKKSQGWIKLTVLALAYVWPDTPGLKLRTLISVLLVIAVRILNIAVRCCCCCCCCCCC
jgi:hypothetical protein